MFSSLLLFSSLVVVALCSSSVGNGICDDSFRAFRACKFLQDKTACNPEELLRLTDKITALEADLRRIREEEATTTLSQTNSTIIECNTNNTINNKCYFILNQSTLESSLRSNAQAQVACEAHQASLLFVNDRAEYDFVQQAIAASQNRSLLLGWTSGSYRNENIFNGDSDEEGFVTWSIGNPSRVPARTKIAIAVSLENSLKGMLNINPPTKLYPICEKTLS